MRILILHHAPDDFRDLIAAACPDDECHWVSDLDEIAPAVERTGPEVVLSIKHSGFPGPRHREALVAPTVKWFHVGGSGTEHLGAWDASRVTLTNATGVLAPFHAEAAMAGLLALSTGLLSQRNAQAACLWTPRPFDTLSAKTLLIVGAGATGGALATRAKAFGVHVVGVRQSGAPHPDVDEMFTPDALPRLLPRADVVSLNVRATPATHHLIDDEALSRLPRGAYLLNGARGSVIDERALTAALASGHLAGAWLDVFAHEPLADDSPLWTMPNVIVSAHCADQVRDFSRRFAVHFLENLERYRRGEPLVNVVTPPHGA